LYEGISTAMGYSIKQKIDICLMAEANPELTQTDLAHWAQKRFNSAKPPSQTTISRILAKKDELIALKEHEYKLIRRRRLSNPLLRKVLLEWITQCVWNNIPITAPIILSSASNFWKQLPEDMRDGTGEFSFKWCSQFLSKVNISLSTIDKDLYSNRLKIWTFEERENLKQLLSVDPSKIYTLGEVFISHDLALDRANYNDKSDFVTCMLCTNVDGSSKLDPLVIGRYEKYPSFESNSVRTATKHGVMYHSNRTKWLTSTMFYDWLSILDKRLALMNRDIILVLDDVAAHRVVNIKLTRIRLLYTSSMNGFLPINWGLENDFKLLFRTEQYKHLIEKQVNLNKKLSKPEQDITMVETFELVKKAWLNLPKARIQSAWRKSAILPDSITSTFEKFRYDDSIEMELQTLIDQLEVQEKWEIYSLLDLSIEQKINKTFLSNEEIIQSCIVDNYDDFDHTTGKALRAPFSHTLGQEFQSLKRLGRAQQIAGNRTHLGEGWDLKDYPIDEDFDFNMDQELVIPQLQDMSELVTSQDMSNLISWDSGTTPMSLDLPWNDVNLGGVEGLTPTHMISNEEKLEIVQSFMDLANNDETIHLSKQTKDEVTALYQRLFNEMS
jgi:hypothetical protein